MGLTLTFPVTFFHLYPSFFILHIYVGIITMQQKEYSPLLKWAGRSLKYFALVSFGFGIACILLVFVGLPQVAHLLIALFGDLFWRLAVLVFGFLAVTFFIESIRN